MRSTSPRISSERCSGFWSGPATIHRRQPRRGGRMIAKPHLVSAVAFVAFVCLGIASAPSSDYDDAPSSPECHIGQLCGDACIDVEDECDAARQDELRTQCSSSPCCVVGKECGQACIEVADTCQPDDDTGNTGNCPTTSACGCSGFRQSECGGACCRWVVGDGCGCR